MTIKGGTALRGSGLTTTAARMRLRNICWKKGSASPSIPSAPSTQPAKQAAGGRSAVTRPGRPATTSETGWSRLGSAIDCTDGENRTAGVRVSAKDHNLERGVVYRVAVATFYRNGRWSDWSEPVSIVLPADE